MLTRLARGAASPHKHSRRDRPQLRSRRL